MGRHSSTQVPPKPVREKRTHCQALTGMARRVWQRFLSEDFRRRMWHRRQAWRAWWDRFYAPSVRGWEDGREWEASLPSHPASWTEDLSWGSFSVGGTLRRIRRERGDLLPEHHDMQEKS